MKRNIEEVLEYLETLDDSDTIAAHNQYCQNNRYEDEIYNNDEYFFNEYFLNNVIAAVRAVSYGEYSYGHEYVKFNGYGNLESFSSPSKHVDLTAKANDILENERDYSFLDLDLDWEDDYEEEDDDENI